MSLTQRIDSGQSLLMDGAMGTELDRPNTQIDTSAWSARAIKAPSEVVQAIHNDYVGDATLATGHSLFTSNVCECHKTVDQFSGQHAQRMLRNRP